MENIFMRFLLVWRSSFLTMWVVSVNHKLIIFEPKIKTFVIFRVIQREKRIRGPTIL